ncbi:MAG: sigma-70 family RNA polymerase sigma factor [Planctomycetaceae bacterium]
MPIDPSDALPGAGKRPFATTQWSVVLAAAELPAEEGQRALAQLCETYWYPLYAFVRGRVTSIPEAQDLTQDFFTHLLERRAIEKAQPDRGRFRAFLLTCLKNFLNNEWQKDRRQKRGGSRSLLSLDFESAESRLRLEPYHDVTPEKIFERRWVLTVLNQVLGKLQAQCARDGKSQHFDQLKSCLTGQATAADYDRAAQALGITPAAAKQSTYRLKKQYRQLFRDEIARTLADEQDLDDEMGQMLENLA